MSLESFSASLRAHLQHHPEGYHAFIPSAGAGGGLTDEWDLSDLPDIIPRVSGLPKARLLASIGHHKFQYAAFCQLRQIV